nr:unnamed protein product [Spirometra erinaceieuropaei]
MTNFPGRVPNWIGLEGVNIPSHEKIRYEYVAKNKSRTAGVIFVIDSVSIQKSLKDVAEYLYNLLADATLAKGRVPFLIVCNKQDLPNAKDIIAVEKLLEDEINTLCITKAGALAGLDSGKESVPLVKSGEKFSFADNKHHRVTFAGCSAIEENIGPVRSWLERQ